MTGEPARSTCSGFGSWLVSRGSNLVPHKSSEITVLLVTCLIGHWFKMPGSECVVGIQLDKWGCQAVNFPKLSSTKFIYNPTKYYALNIL
jgi:hypothetical protein